jgi:flagellin
MADITLSRGIRQNLLSLQRTGELLQTTQNRLSTGRKVNSALDNPGSFFVSQGLTARAGDLATLLDGIGQSIQVLQAADHGITGLTRLIETAQATARSALQAASTTATVESTNAGFVGTELLTASGFAVGNTISVNGTLVTTVAAGTTVQNLVDNINNNVTLNPVAGPDTVLASIDSSGRLVVEGLDGATTLTVTAADGTGAAGTGAAGLAGLFGTATSSTPTTNTTRTAAANQYSLLLTQIDELVQDTGYNGTNLLNGDLLRVVFNESNTTSLSIQGVVFDSVGLGLSTADIANDFQSDSEIEAALTKLGASLLTLRAQASTFGSNLIIVQTREDLTKNMIQTLQDGSDRLVVADQNEEAANLLALQTRQELSTTALSLASQADQAILRLF